MPSSQRCEAGHVVSQPAAAATLALGLHQSANGIAPLTNNDIGGVRVLSSFVFLDTTAFSH